MQNAQTFIPQPPATSLSEVRFSSEDENFFHKPTSFAGLEEARFVLAEMKDGHWDIFLPERTAEARMWAASGWHTPLGIARVAYTITNRMLEEARPAMKDHREAAQFAALYDLFMDHHDHMHEARPELLTWLAKRVVHPILLAAGADVVELIEATPPTSDAGMLLVLALEDSPTARSSHTGHIGVYTGLVQIAHA